MIYFTTLLISRTRTATRAPTTPTSFVGFALMLFEDRVFRKLAGTDGADVRGGTVVGGNHVTLKVMPFRKVLGTHGTLVGCNQIYYN